MDRGSWWPTVPWVAKESDAIERLNNNNNNKKYKTLNTGKG